MKKSWPILILLGCAAIFVAGIARLVQDRFAQGDVYPPYSSLRADPLGAMALYESLEKLPSLHIKRDFSDSNRLPEEPRTVYLHLAASRDEWKHTSKDLLHEIQSFLARGNRLVITIYPQMEAPPEPVGEKNNAMKSARSSAKKLTPAKPLSAKKKTGDEQISLEEEWGFHPSFEKLAPEGETYAPARVVNVTDLPLAAKLSWHSGIVFTNSNPMWRTIYARRNQAVVIERFFGKGSVVIATDSFFVSNEAMESDCHADLLAWLIGANKNVVFDEAHLGVIETSGLAALMRKYRLHAFAGGLLLLAGLFLWKQSTSLVPPHTQEKTKLFIEGKDSSSGFVNLLRRSIPARDLLAVGFEEWKKSVPPARLYSSARIERAEEIYRAETSLPLKERNPIAACKNISNALGTRII